MKQVANTAQQAGGEDTLRHRFEQLDREYKHVKHAFEFAPDALVIANKAGAILNVNVQTEQLFGYGREELRDQAIELLIPKRFHQTHRAYRMTYHDDPKVRPMGIGHELYGVRKDGTEFPVDVSLSPLDISGEVYVMAAIRDITARKQLEQALREQEALNRTILNSLESHIAVLDQRGIIMAVNDAWLRFGSDNGATSENGIGIGVNYLNVCQLALNQKSEKSEEALAGIQAVLKGANAHFELEYPCHSPTEERWFLMSVMPLVGNGQGVVVSHKSVTHLKKVEHDLQQALAEIDQLKDRLQQENLYLQEEIKLEHNFEEIIGQSTRLKQVLRKVEQVAPTTTTVLILGETGTGKELFARALHSRSTRNDRPLVKVNCATLPANLIESELFGHEKGAFTGALQKQIGRFELADGGTIFLDEIGDLPLELQAKLLRVLQEGEFERLGNPRTIKVDVRVLAATNRNLAEEVRKNRFRQDLYYRLSVYTITIPPLRDRKEDIPLLTQSLVQKFTRKIGKEIATIPQNAIEALQHYVWPGNVRELENVIERAVINARDTRLRVELPKTSTFAVDEANKTLEEVERDYILRVLEKTDWRIAGPGGTAEILDINPSTLRSRIQKLGITKPWVRKA